MARPISGLNLKAARTVVVIVSIVVAMLTLFAFREQYDEMSLSGTKLMIRLSKRNDHDDDDDLSTFAACLTLRQLTAAC